jgi:AraC-like DNA-binding protein
MISVPPVLVAADRAKIQTSAATIKRADLSDGSRVLAGSFSCDAVESVVSGWHSHDFHQVVYAFEGVVEVDTVTTHYLLPPQQAVWIPAGTTHVTTMARVRTVSMLFDQSMIASPGNRTRILAVAPVLRETILYAARWPINRPSSDPTADAFFDALARLVLDCLDHEMPLCLPRSSDPLIAAAMEYTNEHLSDVTLSELCDVVGVSERTVRRTFPADTGMSWREYVTTSRLLRAMALLAEPRQSVLEVATRVGFGSVSAFTRGFSHYTGETPSEYRRRVVGNPENSVTSSQAG